MATDAGSSGQTVTIDDDAVVWSVPREERSERLAAEPLVIVMHGRGSHEADLTSHLPLLPGGIVYASLRAPLAGSDYGIGGWTWFALDEPVAPTRASVDAAVAAVLEWLDRVEGEFGAPPAVAGLGFSQGGMMAIELMRAAPFRFAAGVDLSGVSAVGAVRGDDILAQRRPPLFWGRDPEDPVIAPENDERTGLFVPAHFEVTSRTYPGIAHSISREELGDVSAFLEEFVVGFEADGAVADGSVAEGAVADGSAL